MLPPHTKKFYYFLTDICVINYFPQFFHTDHQSLYSVSNKSEHYFVDGGLLWFLFTTKKLVTLKPRIHEHAEWFANQMRVYVDGTTNLLLHLQMVRIPFAANRNLPVFCANARRTGCAVCPFHAPGVLCSPQVCGKLINRTLLTRHTRTKQCVSGALVYTKL